MKLAHFEAFAPACPVCAARGRSSGALVLAVMEERVGSDVRSGILHCPQADCLHEYPIVDGIPVIVPDLAALMAQRGVDFFLRADLPAAVESLLGDALRPDSWFDALRQGFSTYGDLAPGFTRSQPAVEPGAARHCLQRLLALGEVPRAGALALDAGCAAGRTSFELAAHMPDALVLGVDTNFGLLRMAQAAAAGRVSYPLRRIGLVYDRQDFAVALPGAERVDFWALDALALPLAPGACDTVAALNLLDCVAEPQTLLAGLSKLLRQDGRLLLATPFDWSARATAPEHWIGGHSQRADHKGAAEPFLDRLLAGLTVVGKDEAWPWHTRLHARSSVQYLTYLLALTRR